MVTLRRAEEVLRAGQAKAAEMGLAITIAVVDARGDLIALARMDGATFPSPVIAHGKAMASAAIRRPTTALVEMEGTSAGDLMQKLFEGRLVFIPGGVPLSGGGAVGVSGARAVEDDEIATAAAAAVQT
jgi:uncharacterized protein GlcG (DUF336 family)